MDEPLRRMAAKADAPLEPSDEFARRLWDRLSSELAGSSGQSMPLDGERAEVALRANHDAAVQLEPAEESRVSPPRWRRWAVVAVAASILLAVVVLARSNGTSTVTTHRLDPATATRLTGLQPDNDLYQLRATAATTVCTPPSGTATDPSRCAEALVGFETAIKTILTHLVAPEPPVPIAGPLGQYRHALEAELAAVQGAKQALGTAASAQALAAVSNGDEGVCQALDGLDAVGDGVVSVGKCPSLRP